MAQATTPQRYANTWLHFVGLSSDEGRRWIEDYLRFEPVVDMNHECLVLLKRRRWEEGAEHLRRFRAGVDAATDALPATRAMLERWYQAVYGYYWYCLEDYPRAERAMVLAGQAIADAVWHLPALITMAPQCHEFVLHRARIARNQRRWPEMWQHVEEVRGMFRGTRPFCRLADGRGVALADVRDFYASLGELDDEERAAVEYVLDDEVRMRDFHRFVHEMSRLPGFVIRYP